MVPFDSEAYQHLQLEGQDFHHESHRDSYAKSDSETLYM